MKKIFWHLYRKINRLPKMVRIEACSLCQLDCKDCYMRNSQNRTIIGNGYLKYEKFKSFIEKNPYVESIELSFSGEIFLNPELIEIIKFAHSKNIQLTAFNGVNFNNISDKILEVLVKYKFTGLTISIDGASNETYIKYRRNGNFNDLISNIEKLNKYKEKYNSKFPILRWQYIVFEHNRKEINQAIDLAIELKMADIYFKNPWNKDIQIYKIPESSKRKLLEMKNSLESDQEVKNILSKNQIPICNQLWIQPQINWDGRLLGCCCSTNNELNINVFDTNLKKALNCKQMKYMRNVLKGKEKSVKNIACEKCIFFEEIYKRKQFVNEKEFKFG